MLSLQAGLASFILLIAATTAQVRKDTGVYGPALELQHLFYDEWPTGIAVSSTGRKFACYPGGLDKNNTNDGSNGKYTVAELTGESTETPYPSVKINSPPGGAINTTTAMSANYADYLIGVQSVVVDSADRLWILDTGRVQTSNGTLLVSSFGGPKLICVDLTTNKTTQTIIFPQTTVFADSYLNDVRFDLNPSLTSSGKGVAYLSDSSTEGRTGLIIVDLGTGESWRHLDASQYVAPTTQFLAYVWGKALYSYTPGMPFSYLTFGVDGIALSADGETLYFGGVGNRDMWAIPTARLRANGAMSEVLAQSSVTRATQKGVSDGFETDTNGFIYHGNMEQEGISFFNPVNGTDQMFVRDPRISWADTFSIATDGYFYFSDNQLSFGPLTYPGEDMRVRPFAMFRAPLPNGGTKVTNTTAGS